VQDPHALAIIVIWAPVMALVFVLHVGCILVWWHVVPLAFFANWVCQMVLLYSVVAPGFVGLLLFLLGGQFLEHAINFHDFTCQYNDLLLVGIWMCPGSILHHVSVLALH